MTLKEAYESGMPYRHCTHRSWYERGNPAPMNVELAIDDNWEIKADGDMGYIENRRTIVVLKEQIDLGLKRESALATKLGKLQHRYDACRNALKTIKHTECDTYKVAAQALHETAFDKWEEEQGIERVWGPPCSETLDCGCIDICTGHMQKG
jgi:hypothetical protein